ncbi:MAG: GNAT family N-acetyltransferase [Clostridia bacterium]|nr:GNAT family N-acetyltransferase [Clostridia bacterium]
MLTIGENSVIKTERLILRRVDIGDWKAIRDIWADESESSYAQYDKPNATDDESVFRRVTIWALHKASNKHMFFAVCLDDLVIGYVAFNERGGGYEIGYCFLSDYHGKGYAKESIGSLIDRIAESGVKRFVARTALNNTPSVRLLLALGFKREGTEKVSFYKDRNGDDIYFDGGIFALTVR